MILSLGVATTLAISFCKLCGAKQITIVYKSKVAF